MVALERLKEKENKSSSVVPFRPTSKRVNMTDLTHTQNFIKHYHKKASTADNSAKNQMSDSVTRFMKHNSINNSAIEVANSSDMTANCLQSAVSASL